MADLDAIFAEKGLLSQHLEHYSVREAQLLMAQKIADLVCYDGQQKNKILLCEAGTGTGKSFAYLIPAILSRKQSIISTATKNLQDQLYHKDIPLIAELLTSINQYQLNYTMLKGRANYICLYRLEKACSEAWYDKNTQSAIEHIKHSISQTESGDIAEFIQLKEQAAYWPLVTSTSDNCLANNCPNIEQCYVVKARQKASSADIIIINHHLLMADLKLKVDSLGNLLPIADNYFIDEAHQLPDIAGQILSQKLSTSQIKRFIKDVYVLLAKSPSVLSQLTSIDNELKRTIADLILSIRRYKPRGNWSEICLPISPLLNEIQYNLRKLKFLLEPLSELNASLHNCFLRSEQLLQHFLQLTDVTPAAMVHWYDCQQNSLTINLTPIIIGNDFQQYLESSNAKWVFTSATLAVKTYKQINAPLRQDSNEQLFSHFAGLLALKDYQTLQLDSPFDYRQQTLLYLPKNLPSPDDNQYTAALIEHVLPIIDFLQGKTFLLFTSYHALRQARDLFSMRDYLLYVQGDAPRQQLLDDFKKSRRSVLLATSSFWQGVDVQGTALSCVIIDKLPFASPHEPILQAKIKYFQQQGINAFSHYQLPQTATLLKQGVGRLIRDAGDYGIIVIADPRFQNKNYGYYLRKNLPDMPIVTDIECLQQRFAGLKRLNSAH